MRLLNLPQEIQEHIRNNKFTHGHGRVLLEVEDENLQRKLAQETIIKGLSVRELENLIKIHRPRMAKFSMRKQGEANPVHQLQQEQLQHALATKVNISMRKKRGEIKIEFYSKDDLERIVRRITGGV